MAAAPQFGGDHPVKDGQGRAGHEQMVRLAIPLNFEAAPGQVEPGDPVGQAEAMGHHQGGAGASATGQGRARTPLPDPHDQMAGAEHLDKMNIGSGRKGRMQLEGGAEPLEVNGGHILNGNHHMGIAHADGANFKLAASYLQTSLGNPSWAQLQGCGDGGRFQEGNSHVHPDGAVLTELRNNPSCQGLDLPAATGWLAIAVGQEPGQAADAVAAHFGFAAISIENPHSQLSLALGRQGQDHSVSPNAKAPLA